MKERAARDRLSIRAHRPSAARADVTPGPRPCVPLYVLVWRLEPASSQAAATLLDRGWKWRSTAPGASEAWAAAGLPVIPDPSDGGTSR